MALKIVPDWPRLMKRSTAAKCCEMSEAAFEREVIAGRLPQPIMIGGAEHWSLAQIDAAIERLSGAAKRDWREDAPIYNGQAA